MIHKIRCLKSIKNQLNFLRLSSNAAVKETVKYTNTINLPKTEFPDRLNAQKRIDVERKINEDIFKHLYQWQRNHLNSTEFTLHDGPPYANGDLHMGHAVNKILKDLVLRHNIINGTKVHYIPGWDCHGLPIELKAMEKDKNKGDPLMIRQKARNFALQTLEKQKAEFASWGVTADWTDPKLVYRTLDSSYIQNQLQMFNELYNRKLVFRDLKPVYWSPSSQTALAEAELEYDPKFEAYSLLFSVKMVKYPRSILTSESVYAVLWTTTPWSLPSNQLICFHPDLEYCAVKISDRDGLYIVAKTLVESLPNVDQVTKYIMPFHPAAHVLSTKGTGLVQTVPAHGPDDFVVGLERKISPICFVDEQGKYTADAPEFLRNKIVLTEGNELVLGHIAEKVLQSSKARINYPIDWRTKEPVIIRPSKQWFINTDKIKESALQEISKVYIYPKSLGDANRNNLTNQLRNRPYWCISRQRVWGTPIPVFYAKDSGLEIVNKDIIDHLCSMVEKDGNIDFWWTKSVDEIIPKEIWDKHNINTDDVVKGEDILDIWFDSGISWMSVLNPPKIADLYLEGIDQFTGWFQSSLMTSVAMRGHAPFKSLFAHGFTVDAKGRKMSKSLGNIIQPKDIIAKYGTDTLRWWTAAHASQDSSIIVSDGILQETSTTIAKIRKKLRFLIGFLETERNVNDLNFDTTDLYHYDKYFLNSLVEFEDEVTRLYKSYQYNNVIATILNFAANDLSSVYLHLIKDRLYCGTKEEQATLRNILRAAFYIMNKVLWPIMPYMVEECWSYHDKNPFYQLRIETPSHWRDAKYKDLWEIVLDCKEILHQTAPGTNTWMLDISIAASKIGRAHV